jgi:hypothetical protein
VSKKECPEYFARIKKPLDLGAIKAKADKGGYDGDKAAALWEGEWEPGAARVGVPWALQRRVCGWLLWQFEVILNPSTPTPTASHRLSGADLRLVIKNAKVFNPPYTSYWRQADMLECEVRRVKRAFAPAAVDDAAGGGSAGAAGGAGNTVAVDDDDGDLLLLDNASDAEAGSGSAAGGNAQQLHAPVLLQEEAAAATAMDEGAESAGAVAAEEEGELDEDLDDDDEEDEQEEDGVEGEAASAEEAADEGAAMELD